MLGGPSKPQYDLTYYDAAAVSSLSSWPGMSFASVRILARLDDARAA